MLYNDISNSKFYDHFDFKETDIKECKITTFDFITTKVDHLYKNKERDNKFNILDGEKDNLFKLDPATNPSNIDSPYTFVNSPTISPVLKNLDIKLSKFATNILDIDDHILKTIIIESDIYTKFIKSEHANLTFSINKNDYTTESEFLQKVYLKINMLSNILAAECRFNSPSIICNTIIKNLISNNTHTQKQFNFITFDNLKNDELFICQLKDFFILAINKDEDKLYYNFASIKNTKPCLKLDILNF